MRIDQDIKLDYKDVLIRPKRSTLGSRKEVDLNRTYRFKHSGWEWTGIPIMASNMDGVGTLEMAVALYQNRMFTCLTKNHTVNDFDYTVKQIGGNYFAVSSGTSEGDYKNLISILDLYPEIHFICIDIANGYSEHFGNYVAKVRAQFPKATIIAGNVVTADMTQELILRGADIVKVGIGPGSVCTTRIQTGVGYPQLSAVIECADAAHGLGGHIIADGGCTCPGDVAKAFGAGADFVMLGGMLAGHDEGGGEVITRFFETNELVYEVGSHLTNNKRKIEEKKFVQFYGMSSESANNKHFGGLKDYRSSEGRTVLVPYKGAVLNTVQDILGGLRSTCTYAGAKTLKQLSKCTTFVRCTQTHNSVFEGSTIGK
jgi:GMP reductase